MLRVKCTNCDKTFKCPPEHAGERVTCPNCNAHFMVPFDSPDVDAIRERAEETRRAAEPPVFAEMVPAKLDDLIDLHRQQHAELCERLDLAQHDLQSSIAQVERACRGIRSNTTIIGILFLLIVLPAILIGGCGVLAAVDAARSNPFQDLQIDQGTGEFP